MKHVALLVIVACVLAACSRRADNSISIRKAQIDVANSDSMLQFAQPGTRRRFFMLTNTTPESAEERFEQVRTLCGKKVLITDGREVLGTGTIKAILEGLLGTQQGLDIEFQSSAELERIEDELGFTRRRQMADQCMTNMARIVTAARAWATSHDGRLPSDFSGMRKELGAPMVLVCPLDLTNRAAWDWSKFNPNQVTYQIVSPGASATVSTQTCLRCLIHGFEGYANGSIRNPGSK